MPAPTRPQRRRPPVVNDVLVLCYHAVSPTWTADLSVTPDALERQLRLLVDRGYRGATLSEAVRGTEADRTLVVTFDDAYRSVGTLAAPILAKLGLPGTVFVPTNWPDRGLPMTWPGIDHWLGTPHEAELLPLTWEELGTLHQAGWEVGSHTRRHPHLTTLDDEQLAEELTASREAVVARLGSCAAIAYPYGDQDARVREATRRAGYSAGAALGRWLGEGDPFEVPRLGVYLGDDPRRFAIKVSPLVRKARANHAVERAVEALSPRLRKRPARADNTS